LQTLEQSILSERTCEVYQVFQVCAAHGPHRHSHLLLNSLLQIFRWRHQRGQWRLLRMCVVMLLLLMG
jgi:hypothetical protein